jgi:hypothetical protein
LLYSSIVGCVQTAVREGAIGDGMARKRLGTTGVGSSG